MMLKQFIEDLDDYGAIYIRYRLDSSLFNLRKLHAPTKTLEQLFRDLFFVDDAALVAHTERVLQHLSSYFAEAAQLFGLEVNLKKTEVLRQPTLLEEYRSPPHHHRWNWAESSSSVHLSELYHRISVQNRLRSRQQTDQSKQLFRQILRKRMQEASKVGH